MKQLGAVGKTWLTSRDTRVREIHAEMEGQEVSIDQPFLTKDGETLVSPGRPMAGGGHQLPLHSSPGNGEINERDIRQILDKDRKASFPGDMG